jgi:recombination protein RecA
MSLNRRTVEEIEQSIMEDAAPKVERQDIVWKDTKIVSTHSTLLDLAISGGRLYEGGIPCCILAEIFGPAGSGKTAVLAEVGADAQEQDGDVILMDPESRLDQEYAKIYRIELDKTNYYRPETVGGVFTLLDEWEPKRPGPHVALTDSLAALTTEFELDKGDKMGMRRAKEFSQNLRTHARFISTILLLCSNQERDGDYGKTTPGGHAIGYYASLRIRILQIDKITLEKKLESGVAVKKVIGIESQCIVTKSTVDDPYRQAPIYIVFGRGIDDVRGNLQYIKDMKKDTTYGTPDGKSFKGMDQAIAYIENNGLVKQLRANTIALWHEIDELFKTNRDRKRSSWR